MANYRTLFISDVHLGTRSAQADLLLDFLKHNDAETIYLVGDIIDFWRIRRDRAHRHRNAGRDRRLVGGSARRRA